MKTSNFSLENSNLNYICTNVIKSPRYRVWLRRELKKDPNCLEDNVNDCLVDSEVLNQLLDKSKKSRTVRKVFRDLVYMVDGNCISDCFFNGAVTYNDKGIRTSLIVDLSHKILPVHMLKELCKTNICFECYFSLIIEIACDSSYSCSDLKREMDNFMLSPFSCSEMISQLLVEIPIESVECNDKREYIEYLKFKYAE